MDKTNPKEVEYKISQKDFFSRKEKVYRPLNSWTKWG
jgi:hypothetical protein